MMKILLHFLLFLFSCSCSSTVNNSNVVKQNTLSFQIIIDKNVYLNSIYGESPQVAIWLEDKDENKMKTVYVTGRSGKNNWKGKVNCSVALPYWKSRLKKYSKLNNKILNNIDAVTAATSKTDIINTGIQLKPNTEWKFFIEVNVAGDYNKHFNLFLPNGMPDTEGNGQPSIVYGGKVKIIKGNQPEIKILGHTHQTRVINALIKDMENITSAKKIFKKIKVRVN